MPWCLLVPVAACNITEMKNLTITEAARLYDAGRGCSKRYMRKIAPRILGAVKHGRDWLIPANYANSLIPLDEKNIKKSTYTDRANTGKLLVTVKPLDQGEVAGRIDWCRPDIPI